MMRTLSEIAQPKKKSRLGRRNKIREQGLKSLCEDLGDNLVMGITKSNGSVISHLPGSRNFWDQSHVSLVLLRMEEARDEEASHIFYHIFPHNVPIGVVEFC